MYFFANIGPLGQFYGYIIPMCFTLVLMDNNYSHANHVILNVNGPLFSIKKLSFFVVSDFLVNMKRRTSSSMMCSSQRADLKSLYLGSGIKKSSGRVTFLFESLFVLFSWGRSHRELPVLHLEMGFLNCKSVFTLGNN
mmetsp:Transcript_12608/g.17222  ORF Transcript_12608/g.17222 Transcript_12608/m.17222 type:complete len:138 (-) Transcript_12608:66-479(-)